LGPETVQAVVAAYPTPVSLWRAYRTALAGGGGVPAARALLTPLRVEGGRAVGPVKSACVFDRLFRAGWGLAAE
jgi:hypothetical protein